MYFKLSIRNAKRSIVNYLLYITTMTTLLSIMELSNCIAIVGKQVGFQTISLPILITLLLVILVGYIDSFMLKQRAKEFANYLLLGMEKSKLSYMFAIAYCHTQYSFGVFCMFCNMFYVFLCLLFFCGIYHKQTILLRRLNIDVFTCLNFHLPRCRQSA